MAWFHDYGSDYDRTPGYDRWERNPRDVPGMRSSASGGGWRRGTAWDMSRVGRGYGAEYDYLGRRYGYDRDYRRYASEYLRRPPEESPTYGRGGDRAVQRWAQRYGYDLTYRVEPRRGGFAGYEAGGWAGRRSERGRGRGFSDYGRDYQW